MGAKAKAKQEILFGLHRKSVLFMMEPMRKAHEVGAFQLDPVGRIGLGNLSHHAHDISPRRRTGWAKGIEMWVAMRGTHHMIRVQQAQSCVVQADGPGRYFQPARIALTD